MLIDAHAHLDKYEDSLESALAEIKDQRIVTVAVSMDPISYQRSLEIGQMCELVLPTFGVHPKRALEYAHRLSELGPWLERTPMIGEIGLDFHWVEDAAQYPSQRKVLEYFLAAAREQKKIINLHTKGAEKEILNFLDHYEIQRAIVHWYSGPLDILRELMNFGVFFTVGVEVLYSDPIRAITKELPLHQLLTETDNPGGLKWLKGKPGMPAVLNEVVQAIAHIKEMTPDTIARAVQENFSRLIWNDRWLSDWDARIPAFD